MSWSYLQPGEQDEIETGYKVHIDPMEGGIGGWHRREKKLNGIPGEVITVLVQLKRREYLQFVAWITHHLNANSPCLSGQLLGAEE